MSMSIIALRAWRMGGIIQRFALALHFELRPLKKSAAAPGSRTAFESS